MKKQIILSVRSLVLIPFLTTSSSLAILQNTIVPREEDVTKSNYVAIGPTKPLQEDLSKEHADKIDAYYEKRGMPLAGYGEKMVLEAQKNDIDWRLLPAISIKESTGGKFACGNNPFGWGSCKIKFDSLNEAIEVVARNVGGNNPKTARYYKDKTTEEKLARYNSVIPTYTSQIVKFMELIEAGDN
ncbi:MAG: hypothetical protein PHS95_01635 [Candidatus Pacebacteria bacterium]|nr:hypothetical protein [Candidatus Paceibacterota bacterium]